jgi:hypothetical protein
MKMRAWARAVRSAARNWRRLLGGSESESWKQSGSAAKPSARPNAAVAASRTEDSGYAAYGQFVKDELDAQDLRKSSFEQRGLAVITTSGALVTLLFALAALSTTESETFVLPDSAQTWLSIALILFFLSALAALLTNAPFVYQAVEAERIRGRLREDPPRSADSAVRDIAFTRADALEAAKAKNGIKGRALIAAMALEALAVGCVAVAIWIVL